MQHYVEIGYLLQKGYLHVVGYRQIFPANKSITITRTPKNHKYTSTMTHLTISTCNLNQWSLDFTGNTSRILQSCQIARSAGSTYRLGPELEIPGYGCEDHFLESDTFDHSWTCLINLLEQGAARNMLCDFGMPVLHRGVRYNCRVICYDTKILLIRPKTAMADNGNYREGRYFTPYSPSKTNEVYLLPVEFRRKFHQTTAPFGLHYLQSIDGVTFGCESCEELWTPASSHIDLSLRGVEIIGNGSGSHHELRKLSTRMELILNATRKCGGVYLYSNQRGCDGGRTYYDGCAMIVVNGRIVAQGPQFDVEDVTVVTATVDLEDVRSYRAANPAFGVQAVRLLEGEDGGGVGGLLCEDVVLLSREMRPRVPEKDLELKVYSPEEECCLGPACWLWDWLRRSGAAGFFLPLSGEFGLWESNEFTIYCCLYFCIEENARVNGCVDIILSSFEPKDLLCISSELEFSIDAF
jgi:NAD+ synthase (glutamine-hydrolysing)